MIGKSPIKQTISQALRLDRAIRLVWKNAPVWTLVNLVLLFVQGFLPLAALYLMKRIVDAVTAGVTAPDRAVALQQVLLWIVLAAGVALATALARSLGEMANQAQAMVVTDAVSDILHAQSIAVDLEYYEDPAYHDTLHRAQQEAPYRPTSIVNGLVQIGQNTISLIGIAGLLLAFNAPIGLVLFAAALPGALVRLVFSRRLFSFEQKQAKTERRAWYYHWMLTDSGHAKEIRLFDLGLLFRERFRGLRQQMREGRLAITRKRVLADFVAQALASLAVFGSFALVSYQTIQGSITLGSLVMYFMAFQSGLGFVQGLLRSLAGLYEDNLFLTNFYQFLDLKSKIAVPEHPQALPAHIRQGIAFRDVSFSYPRRSEEVLSGIDLTLAPGEVIALVGENGSGKTTLIKLLCRLYDPTDGTISVDGVDLRHLDPMAWRQEISVIFQDYIHYFLSVAENIWLGDARMRPDQQRITRAAELSGADAVIRRLPDGYNTILGSWFEQGHELSIGEWQKVALARAFFRDARILVLDEPSSSLDALAEAELFAQFKQLVQGRSAILISHRFSTVRMADRIYVLEHGRIVEQGTHQELLLRNGQYARLYLAQAGQYEQDVAAHRHTHGETA